MNEYTHIITYINTYQPPLTNNVQGESWQQQLKIWGGRSGWSRLNFPLVGILFFFFFLISLKADGPHHYHPACGHKGSSISPRFMPTTFYRDASSALLQLVNQWLNFTYSRSHAFRYERKNKNPTLVRIELTTSALAGVQITY